MKEKLKISCIKSCQDCEDCIDEIPCKTIRDLDYALHITVDERDSYKQALDKIEKIIIESKVCISASKTCKDCDRTDCLYNKFLDIINKAKEE